MSDSALRQLLIMGLPRTGKTTFLAALWHTIVSKEVTTRLEHKELFGDDEYVNTITRQWLLYEEFERTKTGNESTAVLRFIGWDDNQQIDVVFPDLSGETYRMQWELRQWSNDYRQIVNGANGAILFIHPDRLRRDPTIHEANRTMAEIAEGMDGGKDDNRSDESEWNPKGTATQTVLVELLQFIAGQELKSVPFRVAVVVSAWDKLSGLSMTPNDWFADNLPFLNQYIVANGDIFAHQVYGVSAWGGDPEKDNEELQKHVMQSQRIQIIGPDVYDHDLTGIIQWVVS